MRGGTGHLRGHAGHQHHLDEPLRHNVLPPVTPTPAGRHSSHSHSGRPSLRSLPLRPAVTHSLVMPYNCAGENQQNGCRWIVLRPRAERRRPSGSARFLARSRHDSGSPDFPCTIANRTHASAPTLSARERVVSVIAIRTRNKPDATMIQVPSPIDRWLKDFPRAHETTIAFF